MKQQVEDDAPPALTSLSDLAPAKGKATVVSLPSAHFYAIVVRALTDRQGELVKLAKDMRADGYERQARDIEADAAAVEQVLLPQFRAQREFPLVDGEKFEKAVGEQLTGVVRAAFAGLNDPQTKWTHDQLTKAIERRCNTLVLQLGQRVAAFARDVASAGYTHGYQVRMTDRDAIAASQLHAINGGRAD